MNLNLTKPTNETKEPLGWKCSCDGKYYALFDRKTCKYCIPIYEQDEIDKLTE